VEGCGAEADFEHIAAVAGGVEIWRGAER